jgi:hypothetical protein
MLRRISDRWRARGPLVVTASQPAPGARTAARARRCAAARPVAARGPHAAAAGRGAHAAGGVRRRQSPPGRPLLRGSCLQAVVSSRLEQIPSPNTQRLCTPTLPLARFAPPSPQALSLGVSDRCIAGGARLFGGCSVEIAQAQRAFAVQGDVLSGCARAQQGPGGYSPGGSLCSAEAILIGVPCALVSQDVTSSYLCGL